MGLFAPDDGPDRPQTIRKGSGLIVRGRMLYVKWRVPKDLQEIVGKTHFVRSLRTGRLSEAARRLRAMAYEFESWLQGFENQLSGQPERTIPPAPQPMAIQPVQMVQETIPVRTVEMVFDEFLADPAKNRRESVSIEYRQMIEVIFDVIGRDTAIEKIDRDAAKSVLSVLRVLPPNSSKRYPDMSAKAVAEMVKRSKIKDKLSPVSINKYMGLLSSLMTFAANEGYIQKNPCRGLRVIDPVKLKDKRMPYSEEQLRKIFSSPIYTTEAEAHRNTAKFWVPLIGLYSGMRLNETCALDTADVAEIDGILAFVVSESSDKSLKTEASKRIIPVHKDLMKMGFSAFIDLRRQSGKRKLFPELARASNGSYGKEFSKWYGRYVRKIGVQIAGDRTCYHSLRHVFRDALRTAGVRIDVALALGGWADSSRREVHKNYGSGFPITILKKAIDSLSPLSPRRSKSNLQGK
ncbi:DUF6538 domain-containing protein [Asticcacaulis sp. W401b]|uniref:DUF6538 domain-containing protein n=1 Tax=Asticcacaulis sp. W401b TaxID=3388666 RepID=UPI003970702C